MTDLQIFDVDGHNIRFGISEDGRPYSVAADYAKAMSYAQTKNALDILDEDEKGFAQIETPGGPQRMAVIYEDGMWELIFRSTLPGAKVIKKRVKAILREIRETGSYSAVPQFEIPQTYADALELAASQAREIEAKTARMEIAEGKMREIEGAGGLTMRMFHKKYFSAVREREFFEHLYAKGYLIDQRGKGSVRSDGTVRDGSQHRHPSAKGKPYLYLHFGGIHGERRREYTRVRPGKPELDFKAVLVREGLKPNDGDDGLLFAINGGE